MREVVIVPTGTANMASVRAWLARAGLRPRDACQAAEIERADLLVLPGVGAFGAAMSRLQDRGFVTALRDRIRAGRPTLAICLGLQVLFDTSEESPGVRGLAVLPGVVRRFAPGTRTPHMGWNLVEGPDGGWIEQGHAYFANSYHAPAPNGWTVAWAEHQKTRFVAGFSRGNVVACQFHPELSGVWGRALLERWAEAALEVRSC